MTLLTAVPLFAQISITFDGDGYSSDGTVAASTGDLGKAINGQGESWGKWADWSSTKDLFVVVPNAGKGADNNGLVLGTATTSQSIQLTPTFAALGTDHFKSNIVLRFSYDFRLLDNQSSTAEFVRIYLVNGWNPNNVSFTSISGTGKLTAYVESKWDNRAINVNNAFSDNLWHNVEAMVDYYHRMVKIYFDGDYKGSQSLEGAPSGNTYPSIKINSRTALAGVSFAFDNIHLSLEPYFTGTLLLCL